MTDSGLNVKTFFLPIAIERPYSRWQELLISAEAVVDQAESQLPIIGALAYQLLVEMHARGAPAPSHIQLPTIVWDLKNTVATCSFTVLVAPLGWNVIISAASNGVAFQEEFMYRGSVPGFVELAVDRFMAISEE